MCGKRKVKILIIIIIMVIVLSVIMPSVMGKGLSRNTFQSNDFQTRGPVIASL